MKMRFALYCAASTLILSCGTKKSEERLPRDPLLPSSSEPSQAMTDDPDAREEVQTLTVTSLEADVPFNIADAHERSFGSCVRRIYISHEYVDLSLDDLPLSPQKDSLSDQASCSLTLKVAYRPGWTFAIRKVSLPLASDLKPDVQAIARGRVRLQRDTSWEQAFDALDPEKSPLVERSIAAADLDWAPCDGHASMSLDTQLFLMPRKLPTTTEDLAIALAQKERESWKYGTFGLRRDAPYRFQLQWAPCPL